VDIILCGEWEGIVDYYFYIWNIQSSSSHISSNL
jgi:hypothetical protein